MADFILPRTGILSFLDDEFRELLTSYGIIRETKAGELIIQETTPQTHLYVVITGVYAVSTKAGERDVKLDTVEAGDCFGEVSLFQPGPASATVTCAQAGRLWCMEAAQLQQFLFDAPQAGCALILGINTLLSRRLKRSNAVIRANEIVPAFLSVRSHRRSDTAPSV
ncbi:MAG: cyclic nucleotide-binding domain-containing protein [Methylacidiphilales bacterium]|nr:cyclic nucleotide-binding domain-containing protein [Candidatus Methylacidiphilales bacterium]